MTDSGWFTTPPAHPCILQMRKCGTDDPTTIEILSPGKYRLPTGEALQEGEVMDLPTAGYEYRALEPNPKLS